MHTQARMDTPGALHHIRVRGVEWGLIPNPAHLMFRTISTSLSYVMKRGQICC